MFCSRTHLGLVNRVAAEGDHPPGEQQIEALTATVRKVSERVELSAPAPQMAANED